MATANFPTFTTGSVATPVSGVLWTSAQTTWSASGSTVSWTVPSTINGQTVTKVVITDVVTRLISGTPGTSATYGISIGGNSPYATRVLPTNGGGVDVGLMNLNVQNLSGTYKQANPGDTVVLTSGGTFSGSTVWQFDLLGYYVGILPAAPVTTPQGPIVVAANYSINTATDNGRRLQFTSSSLYTATLPATNASIEQFYEFFCTGSGGMQIAAPSGVVLYFDTQPSAAGGLIKTTQVRAACRMYNPPGAAYWLMLAQNQSQPVWTVT